MRTFWHCTIAAAVISLSACGPGKPPERLAFSDESSELPSPNGYGDYGALWGDFNNDQRLDLIFMGHGNQKRVLMLAQDDDHEFEDVTDDSGIKDSDWEYVQQADRHGASCADFDNDGNIDLFISHGAKEGETLGTKYDELLKGKGDFTFTEVTRAAGTMNQQGRARASVWFDYDNDGLVDLYLLNYITDNVMYKNNGDGTFTDVTKEVGLGFPAVHAAPADYDDDGDIDLLVSWPLGLYRNTGTGQFVEVPKSEFPVKGIFAFGTSWGDVDNDGDLDIFTSGVGEPNMLLINENGRFRKVESEAWVFGDDDISTGVAWGDMENDGLLDIVNVRSDGYFVYLNGGELSFSAVKLDAPPPLIKEMRNGDAAVADYNDDGLLDIATDDLKRYMLLKNTSAPTNNWLSLRFEGTKNNRLGFGNKVWISSQGKLLAYREYTGSAGNLNSASCGPLHVGLALNDEVDIRVRWLNGLESTLHNVNVNQSLTISDADAVRVYANESAKRTIKVSAADTDKPAVEGQIAPHR